MNKAMIFTLGALIGGALGAAGGYFVALKKWEKDKDDIYKEAHKHADKEIEDMRSYYNSLYELSDKYVSKENKKPEKKEAEDDDQYLDVKHDYTRHFDDPAESEHPEEDDEDDPDDRFDDTPEIIDFYEKNKRKPPRLISFEEAGDLPEGVENQVLFFYDGDLVITDDEDNVIDDYERLLGDCLTKYDFVHSEETMIFVMNYELSTLYEITKVMGYYDASTDGGVD